MAMSAQERRTAFVTGATGFVGANLVTELVAGGWDVTALHRPSSRVGHLDRLGVRRAVGDVTDLDSVRRAVPQGVGVIFHVAASLTFWAPLHREQERINVGGTRNVARVALERGAGRLVHTSSIAAFGEHPEPVTEATPSNAGGARLNYFRTKWRAECEVRAAIDAGLDAVILNPANIVGPHDRTGWSRIFLLVERRQVPGAYPGRASWCHAREVARAHVAAAARGTRGANYLLGGTDAGYVDFIRIVAELRGRRPPALTLPAPIMKAFAVFAVLPSYLTRREPPVTPEGAHLVCADVRCRSDKAVRELGFVPVPLRPMAEDAHAWLVGEGLLPAAAAPRSAPRARVRSPR
jgi:dihydroflavonol-4-reductase